MTEDNLRDRMRRADPAASLRPLPPEQARRLLAGAAQDSPARDSRPLLRLPVLVGAAALVAVAAVVFTAGGGSTPTPDRPIAALPTTDHPTLRTTPPLTSTTRPTVTAPGTTTPPPTDVPTSPAATPPPVTSTSSQSTVTVLADGSEDGGGRCPQPDAQYLAANADLAFQGTVLRVEGDVVTLQVLHTWTGAQTDLVQVRNTTAAPVLADFDPEPGQKYLVAADNRQVMGCGHTGPAASDLRALYDQAFPGH
jgi:hypothetical protein